MAYNSLSLKDVIISFNKIHNTEEFRKIHGFDHYDYSLITDKQFKNTQSKVHIKCNTHNHIFIQSVMQHKIGKGCKKCAIDYRSGLKKKNIEHFIIRSKNKHKNKYDYSKSVYKRAEDKICIICPEHGEFWQIAEAHYRSGCPNCWQEKVWNKRRLSKEEFINRSIKLHGNGKFDYSEVVYKNHNTKVLLTCIKCKYKLLVTPNNHLSKLKKGCPHCNSNYSKGNEIVYNLLIKWGFIFEDEFRIDECRYKKPLPFDFVIFDKFGNILFLIEFDGKYHFPPTKEGTRHNKKSYELIKIRDSIKTKYCEDNNIKLIRISYLDRDNIESILTEKLNIK